MSLAMRKPSIFSLLLGCGADPLVCTRPPGRVRLPGFQGGTGLLACLLFIFTLSAETTSGGNGKMYIGGFPNRIVVLDEATERITGEIKTKTGIPYRMSISEDRKRFYIMNSTMEWMEIANIPSQQIVDTFTLSEGNKKVRIRSFEADPLNRYIILLTKSATKMSDHWEIGAPTLLQYDLQQHKVMRTIPWPDGEDREFAQLKFSPDGKFLYLFGEDVIVFDTTDFKQVDKWELSRPLEDGFGRLNFSAMDDSYEEPGYFTGIFNVQDEVQHRQIMGIARVNLSQKSVDFYALGPSIGVSFSMTPDRKMAFGLHEDIGKYEFWSFDLVNRKIASRVEVDGRPRMRVKTSSNGKLLYIFTASNSIDVLDAATYKHLRAIELGFDETTSLFVLPGK